jgi:hypothetical protein
MCQLSQILFLQNGEIDKARYDACINAASNGLIYATSLYLDNMSPDWCALASENYEWVAPVTLRTKWGVTYLYQPPFTQQLGIFAKPDTPIPAAEIVAYLTKLAKFWEVNWNYTTETKHLIPDFKIATAANFTLHLSDSYESLAGNYYPVLTKNLKTGKRYHHVYRETKDYHTLIELYKEQYGNRMPGMKDVDYNNFKTLCEQLQRQEQLICREVISGDGDRIASIVLLRDRRRIYNLVNTITAAGRKTMANHFLLDSVIREFSSSPLLFDFEGSDLPGVKPFYESFGATNQPYFKIKYNNLPWILRLVKR